MRIAGVTAMFLATALIPQLPGDRPAPNPRATRSVVMARNGAIATSQPLATAAGLKVLQSGGNAIDAAVTAAAVLSVVEPTMNGPGGDLFAILYDAKTQSVHGLNASGRAPAAATLEEFQKRHLDRIPLRGPLSVSVPGVVDGWNELPDQARHDHAGAGSRTGHQVRTRRLRRQRNRLVAMARGGRPAGARPERSSGAAPVGQAASGGRHLQESGARRVARADRARRTRCVLPWADRQGNRRRSSKARRAHHRRGPRRESPRLGRAALDHYRGYKVLELPPNTQGIVRSRCSTFSKATI